MFIDKGNSYKHEFIKLHPSDETQSVKGALTPKITFFLPKFTQNIMILFQFFEK